MDGMPDNFSYDIQRQGKCNYICRIYYKNKPFHAFSGNIHNGHIDKKAIIENVKATINYKIAMLKAI